MKIPFYKKVLSFLVPMHVEKTIGANMTVLMVQIYCNQLMLGTPRAIYSFGTRYNPFKKPFSQIKDHLKEIDSFLLLGTGLGSALKILQMKYKLFPTTVLVDNDEDVLKFSIKYMNLNSQHNVTWTCDDACHYLKTNKKKFDLMGVDIFNDLVQPSFVTSDDFIALCANTLTPKGCCIINMILEDDNQILDIEKRLRKHFIKVTFILDKVNTYFICNV